MGQFATEQCGFVLYFKRVFNLKVSLNSVISLLFSPAV